MGLDELRDSWNHAYREHLPALAKSRDPAQPKWPVYLDHCFARVILDNAIGKDRPWTEVLKQPAVKNMNEAQLQAALLLAEDIATGKANLQVLDNRSLELRGKKRKADSTESAQSSSAKKQKRSTPIISAYFLPSPASPEKQGSSGVDDMPMKKELEGDEAQQHDQMDMAVQLKRIADSNLTPFRKQTLTLLCQIPRGRYSTYQAMSDYITKTSHKTCARAVGNAMRNNPFAPEVPCHRVLAADGTLGGFCGHWGENGKYASEKHKLLHEEGVRFDSRGKVKGPVFWDFT